jgi:hypothetical protein
MFSPILVYCVKINLATLLLTAAVMEQNAEWTAAGFKDNGLVVTG